MPAGKGTYGKKRGRPPGSKTTAKGKKKATLKAKIKPKPDSLSRWRRGKQKRKAAKPKNKRRFF